MKIILLKTKLKQDLMSLVDKVVHKVEVVDINEVVVSVDWLNLLPNQVT